MACVKVKCTSFLIQEHKTPVNVSQSVSTYCFSISIREGSETLTEWIIDSAVGDVQVAGIAADFSLGFLFLYFQGLAYVGSIFL